jgi:HAD superfamily hydrolase (TIGR01509 family)
MDGLILDTEAIYRDAMGEAAEALGADLPLAVFLRMVGLPNDASRAVAEAYFGERLGYDAWMHEVRARAAAKLASGAPIKAGVTELLDRLDRLGLPRAIATSSRRETVEEHLRPTGLLDRFDAIVAGGECARGKPHPEPFLTAAARLSVAPLDCLALEDSHNGVRAAVAAGMMTVMVPDLLPVTEEMRSLTAAICADLHEVVGLLADSDQFFGNTGPEPFVFDRA